MRILSSRFVVNGCVPFRKPNRPTHGPVEGLNAEQLPILPTRPL